MKRRTSAIILIIGFVILCTFTLLAIRKANSVVNTELPTDENGLVETDRVVTITEG